MVDFAAYEVAWAQFTAQVESGGPEVRCADVPWPLDLPSVSGIDYRDSKADQKKKLRDALLRWHPDKWSPILVKVREADQPHVLERVKEVTQRILAEKQAVS